MNGVQVCIRPVEAAITHNTEWFGKMSPYIKLFVGGQYHTSSVCRNGGKTPRWSDSIFITIPYNSDPNLRVELWDDDLSKDDNIGMGTYNIAPYLTQQMNTTIPIDVYFKDSHAGRLTICLEFNHQNMGMNPNMSMNPNMGMNACSSMNPGMNNNPLNQGRPVW